MPGVGEIEGGPTTAFSVSGGLAAGNGVLVAKRSADGRDRFFAVVGLTASGRVYPTGVPMYGRCSCGFGQVTRLRCCSS